MARHLAVRHQRQDEEVSNAVQSLAIWQAYEALKVDRLNVQGPNRSRVHGTMEMLPAKIC